MDKIESVESLRAELEKAKTFIKRQLGIEEIDLDQLLKEQSKNQQKDESPENESQSTSVIPQRRERRFTELVYSNNSLHDELSYLYSPECNIAKVHHLCESGDFKVYKSPLLGTGQFRSVYGGEGFLPLDAFIYRGTFVISKAVFGPHQQPNEAQRWLRGGPRKHLFFEPSKVRAAIVTCGGLCPGLNVVIRELVMSLHYNYGVEEIYGIQYGYKGFYSLDWIVLSSDSVKSIHRQGGTILGSSRGGFDLQKITQSLLDRGINQVYCLGGDGTHAGIMELFHEFKRRNLPIAIAGIPKTIDNDIPIIDKSFGFETAVQEAQAAIASAKVESSCAEYGVGLVRLMGRHAGFIAMEACNASREANVCLIPEFKFDLYGEFGLLEYIYKRLKSRGRAVIVVAEGAGEAIQDYKVQFDSKDASGNVKTEDVGLIIKNELTKFCKEKGMSITLKYIDPTYMIRTTAANAHDKNMCAQLAQNAVHGLMAGFSGFTTGHVNNKIAYIPIDELLSGKYANRVQPDSRNWQRLLASTGQPSFLNDESSVLSSKYLEECPIQQQK